MVNILYAITALACSVELVLLIGKMRRNLDREDPMECAFLRLINWTTVFCLIDACWGVLASELVRNDILLFSFSTLFHVSAAASPLVWAEFSFAYQKNTKGKKPVRIFFLLLFFIELGMIIVNAFTHFMFFVNNAGIDVGTRYRRIPFYLQYITYLLPVVFSVKKYFGHRKAGVSEEDNGKEGETALQYTLYTFIFAALPILMGVFQLFFPDVPAYSIGYTLGCCVIYSYIVSELLNCRLIENAVAIAADSAKTEFLFNMSHDIRTPMNVILGCTDIGLQHVRDVAITRDAFEKIKCSGEHLLKILNNILEMSRIEAGKMSLEEKPLDIRDAVKYVREMGQTMARPKEIHFRCELGEISQPYVYGDELHFDEIVIHLLSNAINYTPKGGTVSLLMEEADVNEEIVLIRVTVQDNGVGMSEEFQQHLFESFSRENTSTVSGQEGTGLGLSIVKKLVGMAGGTISVRSEKNIGSSFVCELPFRILEPKEESAFLKARSDAKTAALQHVDFTDRKVLLVEDNLMNRDIAVELLNEKGVITDTAEDGKIALDRVKTNGIDYYDFILMDIQMPIMDGYEATKQIRALPGGNRVPIIALSANAFEEDKARSLEAGMNAHVAKPVNINELLMVMNQYARNSFS